MLFKMNKSKNFTLGYIMVLHTFPTAVFPIKSKKGTGFLQCLKFLLCTFQILLYLFSYVNQVLYVPSKPHTVYFNIILRFI